MLPGPPYPVNLSAEVPERSSRLLALAGIVFLKGLLLLPHLVVLYFVGLAALVVGYAGYWWCSSLGGCRPGCTGS